MCRWQRCLTRAAVEGAGQAAAEGLCIAMTESDVVVEGVSKATLDPDRLLAEAVHLCEGRHISVP